MRQNKTTITNTTVTPTYYFSTIQLYLTAVTIAVATYLSPSLSYSFAKGVNKLENQKFAYKVFFICLSLVIVHVQRFQNTFIVKKKIVASSGITVEIHYKAPYQPF